MLSSSAHKSSLRVQHLIQYRDHQYRDPNTKRSGMSAWDGDSRYNMYSHQALVSRKLGKPITPPIPMLASMPGQQEFQIPQHEFHQQLPIDASSILMSSPSPDAQNDINFLTALDVQSLAEIAAERDEKSIISDFGINFDLGGIVNFVDGPQNETMLLHDPYSSALLKRKSASLETPQLGQLNDIKRRKTCLSETCYNCGESQFLACLGMSILNMIPSQRANTHSCRAEV